MSSRNMSSGTQATELDDASLVYQLNDMLNSLNLPISLISPTDLTPGLLIAILESILVSRIPYVDRDKESKRSRNSKIQNMKIFLGVLENDVLKMDVGLSNVDPRRLADGECDEVYFIAELLCWFGRKMGFIQWHQGQLNESGPSTFANIHRMQTEPLQSSVRPPNSKSQLDLDAESVFQGGTNSTVTGSLRRSEGTISPFFKAISDSNTSLFSGDHEGASEDEDVYSDGVSDILGGLSPLIRPEPTPPRCIHEISSPSDSLLMSVNPPAHTPQSSREEPISLSPFQSSARSPEADPYMNDLIYLEHNHPGNHSRSPIRYEGFIEPVDEDFELESFRNSRSRSLSSSVLSDKLKPSVKLASVKKEYTRTLELLNERAQLLTQLAALKNPHG